MKYLFCIFALLSIFTTKNESISGLELLEKSIEYHDPKKKWDAAKLTFILEQTTPAKAPRLTVCKLDNETGSFWQHDQRAETSSKRSLINGECQHWLNEKTTFTEDEIKEHRLTCKWTKFWKNYQSYLYGLPMKLKDPGTIVHDKVDRVSFFNQDALKLKVTYEEEVGKDIWYFYFDPATYALISYQFFHEEEKNDGEYILLDGEVKFKGMKFPKTRKWYYNKDDKFLGTDVIKKVK